MIKRTNVKFLYVPICLLILLALSCQKKQYVANDKQSELTFFVASDTHFGVPDSKYDSVQYFNQSVVKDMNCLPGTAYPDTIGGNVGTPKGVLISGDLTDGGTLKQWQQFTKYYGLTGEDGMLKYPLYEGAGNHDGGPDGPVREGIRQRNKKRAGVNDISETGLHYSFDWGNIHFVNLNMYPTANWDPGCDWCKYFDDGIGFANSEQSLQFLKKNLQEQVGESDKPVILYFHVGFRDWNKVWWTKDQRDAFYEVVEPYNIVAIFRGHTHSIGFNNFQGIPVYAVGSTQKEHGRGEFVVVRVQDNKMLVIERDGNGWGQGDVVNF